MQRTLRLVVLLVASCLAPSARAAAPTEGSAAPAFEAVTLDGRRIDVHDEKGKVVMVHFWATWCAPCREEMPVLEAFYRQHRRDGLEIVAISVEEAGAVDRVKAVARGFSFPVAMIPADKVGDYGPISFLPLTYVIDRQGIVRKTRWTGPQGIDAARLDRYVAPLLREP